MMEEKEEKCFCQALIISFFYFFLSKNRIQDYVLGLQRQRVNHHSLQELVALSASEFTKFEFLKLQTVPMKKDFALTSKITASETVPQSHLRLAIRRYTSKGPEQHEMQ